MSANDRYPGVLKEIGALASRRLVEVGSTAAGELAAIPGTERGAGDAGVNVWAYRNLCLVIPTLVVLKTNVERETRIPKGMKAMSDFADLRELKSLTIEKLREFPLHARTEDGTRFKLATEQIASIVMLMPSFESMLLIALSHFVMQSTAVFPFLSRDCINSSSPPGGLVQKQPRALSVVSQDGADHGVAPMYRVENDIPRKRYSDSPRGSLRHGHEEWIWWSEYLSRQVLTINS